MQNNGKGKGASRCKTITNSPALLWRDLQCFGELIRRDRVPLPGFPPSSPPHTHSTHAGSAQTTCRMARRGSPEAGGCGQWLCPAWSEAGWLQARRGGSMAGKPPASSGACELLPALGASPKCLVSSSCPICVLIYRRAHKSTSCLPLPRAEPRCCQKLRMPQPAELG